ARHVGRTARLRRRRRHGRAPARPGAAAVPSGRGPLSRRQAARRGTARADTRRRAVPDHVLVDLSRARARRRRPRVGRRRRPARAPARRGARARRRLRRGTSPSARAARRGPAARHRGHARPAGRQVPARARRVRPRLAAVPDRRRDPPGGGRPPAPLLPRRDGAPVV
ncbi:MAG: hypothetical protein AVDCRST_MAG79-1017, partial [uncultured Thermoleophilia bacterium]